MNHEESKERMKTTIIIILIMEIVMIVGFGFVELQITSHECYNQ